ncbi:MAG: BamA/TamA family outer membrane protein [Myxococcota bacterium]
MGFLIFFILFSLSAWSAEIQVVGSRVFRAETIRSWMQSKIGEKEVDVRQLDQWRVRLQSLYRQAGFVYAQVDFEKPRKDTIICRIKEGEQILIGNITVVGSSYFSDELLRRKVIEFARAEPMEPGWMDYDHQEISSILNPRRKFQCDKIIPVGNQSTIAPPPGCKNQPDPVFFEAGALPYNKSLFLKAKDFLEDFYLDNGFLDVQIFGPKESEIIGGHWVNLQYRIIEGPQTRISKIVFEGMVPKIKNPPIHVGDPLNHDNVEDFRVQIEEYFWNQGYPNAEIVTNIRNDEIYYQINLGERVKIEKIDIVGNQLTKTPVIRRRLTLKAGDWYSLEKITESRSRILQTDLFSDVSIDLNGSTLIISVKERDRNTFELGMGASLVDGPRLTGIWQHRNILGLGITFRTRAQVNYPAVFYDLPVLYSPQVSAALKNQTSNYIAGRVSAGFLYLKMLSIPFDLDSSIDVSAERVLQQAYVLNNVSSTLSFFSQVLPRLRLTPQLELEYANFDCPTCGQSNRMANVATRFDQGIVRQGTVRLLSLWDGRDNTLLPKKGFTVELNTDFGIGDAESAKVTYVKLVGGVTTYVPLVNRLKWVFNVRAGGIWNVGAGEYVPLFKRFYLGGTNSVRGFQDNQIFPVDDTQTNLVSLGGSYMIYARNELRFPIVGDLEGGIFIDTGELMLQLKSFDFQKLALGTGMGIRYNTPIGPLMLDIGMRIFDAGRIPRDSFISLFGLHFSIGNAI